MVRDKVTRKRATEWEVAWGEEEENAERFPTKKEALDHYHYLDDNNKRLIKIKATWTDLGHGTVRDFEEEREDITPH